MGLGSSAVSIRRDGLVVDVIRERALANGEVGERDGKVGTLAVGAGVEQDGAVHLGLVLEVSGVGDIGGVVGDSGSVAELAGDNFALRLGEDEGEESEDGEELHFVFAL